MIVEIPEVYGQIYQEVYVNLQIYNVVIRSFGNWDFHNIHKFLDTLVTSFESIEVNELCAIFKSISSSQTGLLNSLSIYRYFLRKLESQQVFISPICYDNDVRELFVRFAELLFEETDGFNEVDWRVLRRTGVAFKNYAKMAIKKADEISNDVEMKNGIIESDGELMEVFKNDCFFEHYFIDISYDSDEEFAELAVELYCDSVH